MQWPSMILTTTIGLNAALWNCNGTSGKIQEIQDLVRETETHILLLNETRAPEGYIFHLQGYNVVEKRGRNEHGGVAIAARDDVPHQDLSNHLALSKLQAVALRLACNTVIVAYFNSPSQRLRAAQLRGLFRMSRKVLLAGDYNATHTNWGCRRNNANGNVLNGFLANNAILLHHPSVADLVLTSNVTNIGDITVQSTSSDHVALLFQLGEGPPRTGRKKIPDYSRANWKLYRTLMNEHPVNNSIEGIDALDDAVASLTDDIVRAAKRCVPTKIVDLY